MVVLSIGYNGYNAGDAEHITVVSDDPTKICIGLLSYKEQYCLSTMPRGIYNIKYKIVLTDLHPLENVRS